MSAQLRVPARMPNQITKKLCEVWMDWDRPPAHQANKHPKPKLHTCELTLQPSHRCQLSMPEVRPVDGPSRNENANDLLIWTQGQILYLSFLGSLDSVPRISFRLLLQRFSSWGHRRRESVLGCLRMGFGSVLRTRLKPH